jgi:hypothetical protein
MCRGAATCSRVRQIYSKLDGNTTSLFRQYEVNIKKWSQWVPIRGRNSDEIVGACICMAVMLALSIINI